MKTQNQTHHFTYNTHDAFLSLHVIVLKLIFEVLTSAYSGPPYMGASTSPKFE
jgi:hypothetical protein